MAAGPDREKALDLALSQIEKQFGKGSVMRLGERPTVPMSVIPTGSIALDVALGVGGLPRGRIVEIYGPEASGKTSLALHAIANAQAAGGIAAFIDAEHALDPDYARALGVDTDALLVSQPDTGEQALEIADMLVRSGALDLIVIDSVAALVPRAEIEGEMGDSHVGLQARLMSQALRKITGALNHSGTTAIFINQLREKIGIMFGSPETTTGGRALKFYSSVRLDVRRIESLKDGTDVVGNRTRVKVVKNKCLAEGTTVFDPTTGRTHRIEEIVDGRLAVSVVAAAKDGSLHVRPVVSWFDQGEQDVIGIRLRGGAALWATPDHKVLTDRGWALAGELKMGDRVAQPRQFLGFGDHEPYSPEHARMLGYLIGDGYVGGKTPLQFINVQESLKADASRIAASLGCDTHRHDDKLAISFSHRIGERNELLALCREADIYGKLAWEKTIPVGFMHPEISREVVGNLLFGLFETDGWVSKEQTGAVRVGYGTTSVQLAHQLHWLLLRCGITSSVRKYDPTGQRPSIIKGRRVQGKRLCYEVRVTGSDNVEAFAEAIPLWGPRGQALRQALDTQTGRRRGSQAVYLSPAVTQSVLAHLANRGITPTLAAQLVGPTAGDPRGGMKQVLGLHQLRRDRLQLLADALDDSFLQSLLAEQIRYATVKEILPRKRCRTFDIEVDELHTFVADSIIVHNCASPFKQAEFDIMYGKGISREGSLIDVGVEQSIIRKSGAWYTYDGDQLGQGKENARNFLKENPDVAAEIEKKILEKLGVGVHAADAAGGPALPPVDF
ncbi:MAG TPA: intein-containing recombinase RecA [Micromonosporaceae bacterium]|nr:intein-containing recombinase RecA [Micromonosporaceae bacterium]